MLFDYGDSFEPIENAFDADSIQWLDCVRRNERDSSTLLALNSFGNFPGHLHNRAIRDDANVLAFSDQAHFAKFKRLRRVSRQVGFARFSQSQIRWPISFGAYPSRGFSLQRITWRENRHVRDRAYDCDVLLRMMCSAQRRVRNAAANSHHRHGQILIAKIDPYLLKRTINREGRDRVCKSTATAQRKAGAKAYHGLLCYTDIDELIR